MTDILLDVEEVLADTHGQFCKMYNNLHQTDYTKQDITSWDWVEKEVDYDEFMHLVDRAWTEGLVEPNESGLADTVERLTREYEVDIITARTGVESEMQEWLHENGIDGYRRFESIEPTKSKSVYGTAIVIDDRPHLADELDEHQTQYMIQHPWNEMYWDHSKVKTAETVQEVAERLTEPKQLVK